MSNAASRATDDDDETKGHFLGHFDISWKLRAFVRATNCNATRTANDSDALTSTSRYALLLPHSASEDVT
jgi:hypothetical protein